MKSQITMIVFMTMIKCCFGQTVATEVTPYFSGVIVSNIETSSSWYQSVFSLKVKSRIDDPDYGAKVAILESSKILIELLEMKAALAPKDLLQVKPEGSRIRGHFKIGFKVSDMDEWLKRMASLKIPVDRVYTDAATRKRNFLINDPDGNLIQFFE
jgi:catechol 2,3-dioxygenase-like lactoylglutathione lyase family enzyme